MQVSDDELQCTQTHIAACVLSHKVLSGEVCKR